MTTTKVTDATAEPIALDEAKRPLRGLADGDTDPDITQVITDARTAAENRLQRSIMPTTWLHTRDTFPGLPGIIQGMSGLTGYERASQIRVPNCIQLLMPPVTAVAWVKYVDLNGVVQTLDPTQYLIDFKKEPAEITPAYGVAWPLTRNQPGAVTVQYTAGYADAASVPGPIKRWIKLALTDLYQNRGRSSDRPVAPQDFADELLDPYAVQVI
jgi:hypothetical protein